jgi:hypothetical protein
VHPARIMHLPRPHHVAIRRHDPAQRWHRERSAMLRQWAIRAQPPAARAAIAGNVQRGKAGRDLAQCDDAGQLHAGPERRPRRPFRLSPMRPNHPREELSDTRFLVRVDRAFRPPPRPCRSGSSCWRLCDRRPRWSSLLVRQRGHVSADRRACPLDRLGNDAECIQLRTVSTSTRAPREAFTDRTGQ